MDHIEVADKYYTKALLLNNNNFNTTLSFAHHTLKAERFSEALTIFDRALEISQQPNKTKSIFNGKALTFFRMENFEKAEEILVIGMHGSFLVS